MPTATARVGLEDNLFIGKGQLAKHNAELVQKMVRLLDDMSLAPASPDEARQLLQLKGRHAVGF